VIVELGDRPGLGDDDRGVRPLEDGVGPDCRCAQQLLSSLGLVLDVTAAGPAQRNGDGRSGQPRRASRVRGLHQQLKGIWCGQVLERGLRGGKNSRYADRSRCTCRVRSQMKPWCDLATSFRPSAAGLSPATGR